MRDPRTGAEYNIGGERDANRRKREPKYIPTIRRKRLLGHLFTFQMIQLASGGEDQSCWPSRTIAKCCVCCIVG